MQDFPIKLSNYNVFGKWKIALWKLAYYIYHNSSSNISEILRRKIHFLWCCQFIHTSSMFSYNWEKNYNFNYFLQLLGIFTFLIYLVCLCFLLNYWHALIYWFSLILRALILFVVSADFPFPVVALSLVLLNCEFMSNEHVLCPNRIPSVNL